jgi:hypothetical protein
LDHLGVLFRLRLEVATMITPSELLDKAHAMSSTALIRYVRVSELRELTTDHCIALMLALASKLDIATDHNSASMPDTVLAASAADWEVPHDN